MEAWCYKRYVVDYVDNSWEASQVLGGGNKGVQREWARVRTGVGIARMTSYLAKETQQSEDSGIYMRLVILSLREKGSFSGKSTTEGG